MSWKFAPLSLNSIVSLLETEDTTLEDVLNNTAIITAMSRGDPTLFAFLLEESHLSELCNLVFEQSSNRGLVGTTMFVLTANGTFIKKLTETPFFITKMQEFLDSPKLSDPVIFGNFERILEFAATETNGEILTKLPNLTNIFKKFDDLAIREMFVNLVPNFYKILGIDDQFLESFIAEANFTQMNALRRAVQTKNELGALITGSKCINSLLDVFKNTKEQLLQVEAIKLLQILSEENDHIKALIRESLSSYEPSNAYVQSKVIDIVPEFGWKHIEKLMDPEESSILKRSIMNSTLEMDQETLIRTVYEKNLLSAVIDKAKETKTDGSLITFADYLSKIQTFDEDPKWVEFVNSFLQKRLKDKNRIYGMSEEEDSC